MKIRREGTNQTKFDFSELGYCSVTQSDYDYEDWEYVEVPESRRKRRDYDSESRILTELFDSVTGRDQ